MRSNRPAISWRSSGVMNVSLHVTSPYIGWRWQLRNGGTNSEHRAPGGYRPQALNLRLHAGKAAHAYVPVVQVHGRVAVAWDEQHLVAASRPPCAVREVQHAMLVRGPMIGGARQ